MRFTKTHEWVKVEGAIATVGITRHAEKEIGEVVYVELPKVGHAIRSGEVIAILESTKAAIDLYSPLSGEVVEVNLSLKEHPEKINQQAEEDGWIYKIKIENPTELKNLLSKEEYSSLLKNSL